MKHKVTIELSPAELNVIYVSMYEDVLRDILEEKGDAFNVISQYAQELHILDELGRINGTDLHYHGEHPCWNHTELFSRLKQEDNEAEKSIHK